MSSILGRTPRDGHIGMGDGRDNGGKSNLGCRISNPRRENRASNPESCAGIELIQSGVPNLIMRTGMTVPPQDFLHVQHILCVFRGLNQGHRDHRNSEISWISMSLWWGIIYPLL